MLGVGLTPCKMELAPPSWNLSLMKVHIGSILGNQSTDSPFSPKAHRAQGQVIGCALPVIWILTRILKQFCSQGHFWFYRAIQEIQCIGCSYKLPFIDYQLSTSIELCTPLLSLPTLFENLKNKKANVIWQIYLKDISGTANICHYRI